jgi:hypothetical protein
MADVNTTDSTPTPTETPEVANPNPETGSENISTTDPSPKPEDGGTILGGPEEPEGDEPKPEDKPEPTEEEKARAALFGAPEGDYEIAGLPEGMGIDKTALDAVTPVAKELGLSNEGFSKLDNVYATQIMPQVTESVVDNLQKDIAAQHAAWATEALEMVNTDETFAGQKLDDVKSMSAKAIDRFGGADFRKYLNDTGLGNHPAMLKFAYLAGTAIAEDTTFERGGSAPVKKSRTDKYYGS